MWVSEGGVFKVCLHVEPDERGFSVFRRLLYTTVHAPNLAPVFNMHFCFFLKAEAMHVFAFMFRAVLVF